MTARHESALAIAQHLWSTRLSVGAGAPRLAWPSAGRPADVRALVSELVVTDAKDCGSTPRLQRVGITFHDVRNAEDTAAALRSRLAGAAPDTDCGSMSSASEVHGYGERVVIDALIATSSLQDERDADHILAQGLKGDDAILAWSHCARRLSEAAGLTLGDLDLADREGGCGLASTASAVTVCAQPLGMPRQEASPAPAAAPRRRGADLGDFAVTVTLAGQRDAAGTAQRMREAQDQLRSDEPPLDLPSYPTVRAAGERTTIGFRVRLNREAFAGSYGGLVSALIPALWSVSCACEHIGSVVCSAVTAAAQRIH